MSDSFADLWSASGQNSQSTKNQTLSSLSSAGAPKSVSPNPQAAYRKPGSGKDAFSMLAQAGSGASSPRSYTPVQGQGQSQHQRASPKPAGGGDAFSGLLSGTSVASKGAGNESLLSLAQKQASRNTPSPSPSPAIPQQTSSSAWAGLDSLGGSSSFTSAPSNGNDDLFDFGVPTSTTTAAKPVPTSSTPAAEDDDWGLGDFTSAPPPTSPAPPSATDSKKKKDIWDIDPSDDTFGLESSSARKEDDDDGWGGIQPRRFDYENDDDDILGDLGKPVDKAKAKPALKPTPESLPPAPAQSTNGSARPASPPPHILGQLISMGFSVPESKAALNKTRSPTGDWAVEQAVEILVGGGGGDPSSPRPTPEAPPRRQRPSANRQTSSSRARNQEEEGGEGLNPDKLIAQASEIGGALFSKGLSMWKQGREMAQKAYEERVASGVASGSSTPRGDGRPKWMVDAEAAEVASAGRGGKGGKAGVGFRDEDEEVPKERVKPSAPPKRKEQARDVDLFSSSAAASPAKKKEDEPAKAYVSPFRRGKPAASTSSPAPTTAPAPAPRKKRPHPSTAFSPLDPSTQASLAQRRKKADEAVKLGQYGGAEDHFSSALELVSGAEGGEKRVENVDLYLGRGEARIVNGKFGPAGEDAAAVLGILLVGSGTFDPSEYTDKDAGRFAAWYVHALKLSATAAEGRERWAVAMKDWESVVGVPGVYLAGMGAEGVKVRDEAVRGRGRCKAAIDGPASRPAAKTAATKAKARTNVPTPTAQNNAALASLRTQNAKAAREDDERLALKDSVDARIAKWRNGKEGNLRALIAGMKDVLWEGADVKVYGLHELVQEKQVKIAYMKCVGRVHPDKMNPATTTLEQRMIANAVFGILNEAWNKHNG